MQILKIKLSKNEQDAVYSALISSFKIQDEKQIIESGEGHLIEIESELELYTEYHEPDENNQTSILSRGVIKFRLTFYHNGDEVEVEDWDIEDRIKKYYEV